MSQGFARKAVVPGRARRRLGRFGFVAALAALSLAASTSTAMAVTIGQIAPAPNPPANCDATPQDFAQPTFTSGDTYVVPPMPPATSLVISSWSHTAFNGPGQQITMKVWRHVSGQTYRAVAHDGPRAPNPGVVNTFSGLSVPVEPGDVLGLGTTSADNTCIFSAPGETLYSAQDSNAADGEQVAFFADPGAGFRANVSAVVEPSNTFTLGATTRNKKRGTATVSVSLPNPGDLTGSGTGVNASSAAATSKAVGAGSAQLLVKATGKKLRKLNQKGKVKLNVAVTYTPSGGQATTQPLEVKLKKKL